MTGDVGVLDGDATGQCTSRVHGVLDVLACGTRRTARDVSGAGLMRDL